MALKNKDGSTYKLAKPNPIMKDQTLWDNEKFIVHNMTWTPEKSIDDTEINPLQTDLIVQDSFISELEITKEEPQKEEEPVFERKTVTAPDLKKIEEEKKPEINKIFVHCLPATIRTKKDDLYDEIYQTIQYGKPTSFEAVIILETDVSYEIWTDADVADSGAVLFPRTNTKRWWKVKKRVRRADGWILSCIMSDYQPSFDS